MVAGLLFMIDVFLWWLVRSFMVAGLIICNSSFFYNSKFIFYGSWFSLKYSLVFFLWYLVFCMVAKFFMLAFSPCSSEDDTQRRLTCWDALHMLL